MGEGYMNGARALGLGPAVRVPRPLEADGVGAALASAQKQIVNCGRSLAGLVEPAGQALIGEAINRLDQQVFRVAVVGQIKSGKSSFINAFVRQPRLLPTDVTPWTTTVTHLHFGEPSPGAASFQFFSAAEWHDLANGDQRVRELVQAPRSELRAGSAAPSRRGDEAACRDASRRQFRRDARQLAQLRQLQHRIAGPLRVLGRLCRQIDARSVRRHHQAGRSLLRPGAVRLPRHADATRPAPTIRSSFATRSPGAVWNPPISTSSFSPRASRCRTPTSILCA